MGTELAIFLKRIYTMIEEDPDKARLEIEDKIFELEEEEGMFEYMDYVDKFYTDDGE